MRIVRTARGARIIDGDAVLSEILARPGPTHSVWDLLAAAVAVLAPGGRIALLGFAGGGLVAPLRAVGWEGSVDAVDLDPSGERLFRELCGDWCGSVRFRCAEAAAWLRRSRRRYEAILDDLSIARRGAITKPGTSFEELPALIRRRLAGGGVAAVNSLPVSGMSWRRQRARLVGPHRQARVVLFREFENRVVLGGDSLPPVRSLSRRLRGVLREIDSRIAESISVRDPADGQEGSDPGIAPFRRPT